MAGLFHENRVVRRGASGRELTYHAPSLGPFPGRYPHQWFWDSCAHAIALRHIDPGLAREELLGLLAAQHEDGFIPHQIFNPSRMAILDRITVRVYRDCAASPYLQPPVLAQAVLAVERKRPGGEFLSNVLPLLKRYHDYLRNARGLSGDGLLEIIHSYESGKDRSREYDEVYGHGLGLGLGALPMARLILQQRRLGWDLERILAGNLFRVKDLLFNCIYAADLGAIAELCDMAGEHDEAQAFRERRRKTEAGILGKMYDAESGLFYSLDSRHGADRQIRVSTFSTFLPLLFDSIEESKVERLVEEHLANPSQYWLEYPVPAEPLGSAEAGKRNTAIWRGLQTWVYLNWFIGRGLLKQAGRFPERRHRHSGLAGELAERTYKMVRRSGFREFYHSRSGRGGRAVNFGMSALALDLARMVAEPALPPLP